jgi:hypothetical protein
VRSANHRGSATGDKTGMLTKLSNNGETEVFKQISPIADRYRSAIYRKVRVADIVE